MRKHRHLLAAAALCVFQSVSPCLPSAQDGAWVESRGETGAAPRSSRLSGARSIKPGKDLKPRFSDSGRARAILKVIADVYYGRPLQYPKDGTVFFNREGRLPERPKGYYREYTIVPPPGSPSRIMVGDMEFQIPPANGTRGAERLVIGKSDEAYYSPDHYKTFLPLTIVR